MKTKMRRREWIGGAAALLGAGCGHRPQSAEVPSPVAVIRASYGQSLYGDIARMLRELKPDIRGRRIVLKPNLVEWDSQAAINTNPIVVHAALEAFRSMGAAQVLIAEAPGHRRDTWDLASAAGYFDLIPDFERLFIDLNVDEVAKVAIPRPKSRLSSIYLPRTVLGCDLLVSMPKMKTHHWVGATLSMKNLFGVVPGAVYGWPKNVLHWSGISESIADLHSLFPQQFAIVDGIIGMEGNGPIQGTPKAAGVIVAGSDPRAVDGACCQIMAIDPARIEYLRLTGYTSRAVHPIGEPIPTVRNQFALPPGMDAMRLV